MEKLTPRDLWPLDAYERLRDDFRRSMTAYERSRRLDVGDRLTLRFENRKTVKARIMELLWAGHALGQEAIEAELAAYNALVPGPGELVATLTVATAEGGRGGEEIPAFLGVERSVWLTAGGSASQGVPTGNGPAPAPRSLRFLVPPILAAALADEEQEAAVEVRHPAWGGRRVLPAEVRGSLLADLAG